MSKLKIETVRPPEIKNDFKISLEVEGVEAVLLAILLGNFSWPSNLRQKCPTLDAVYNEAIEHLERRGNALVVENIPWHKKTELLNRIERILDDSELNR